MAKIARWRRGIQVIWAAATNGYLAGFASGKLYAGGLKAVCVPGLTCYSCPGALGACPMGALQAVLADRRFHASLYVAGFLTAVGALLGRFVCGWLCPFGLIQELLHKIPFPKKIKTFRGDRLLRYAKYAVLAVLVILLPMFAVDATGQGGPWFCKWLCPVGTLEAGIPLVFLVNSLKAAVGWLYAWKLLLLAAVLFASVLIYRPFCKYLCPLGAVYALFNPVSLCRVKPGPVCSACQMGCRPNDRECIRCAGAPSVAKGERRSDSNRVPAHHL